MAWQMRWTIFITLTTVLTHEIVVSCLEISSQIDLDSEEVPQTTMNSSLKALVNLNEGAARLSKNSQTSKVSSLRSSGNTAAFVRSADSKKRRAHFTRVDTSKLPTVINNIQIVVNGNQTGQTDEYSCKNGICNVSVSSKLDGEGNIVTDVHLSITTKLNNTPEVGDIPVFDGIRGSEGTYDRPPSVSYGLNQPTLRPFIYNNIPQIQTYSHDVGRPWGQGRNFQGVQRTWYNIRSEEPFERGFQGHRGFQGQRGFQRGWVPNKPVVDDKIEPPLSKTQGNDE